MISTKNKSDRECSPKKRLGYGYFIAAAVFLFNPCINIVDILPDFFGYMFLLKGLEKWADICPNVADAVQGISRLRWFMLIKLFAILLIPIVREPNFVLLITFSFIIIELIYAIPASGRIFDGMEYFGTRFDGKTPFFGLKDIRLLTKIFFFAKSAFCLLPELCALSSYDYYGYVTSNDFDIARYKGLFIVIGLLMSAMIGILWLVNIISYINRISRENGFLTRVLHDYDLEITENVGIALRRTLHSTLTLMIAGFVFFLNVWVDGVNIVPTVACAVFLIAAMLKLRRISPVSSTAIGVQIAFAVVSVVSLALSLAFSLRYDLRAITLGVADPEVLDLYNYSLVAALLEYAFMAAAMCMIFRELHRLIDSHLGPDPDVKDRRLIAIYDESMKAAHRGVIASIVMFCAAFLLNVGYILLRAQIDTAFWLIPFAASGIWLAYTVNMLWQIYGQIEYKYT